MRITCSDRNARAAACDGRRVWPGRHSEQGSNAFCIFLSGDDADEITAPWQGLSDGAEVRQPFGASAWSPLSGQLRDRFGAVRQLDVRVAQA